ncbi:MAG: PQQ-dependent sugar dehydrogenase [Burkholderiales bacterium]
MKQRAIPVLPLLACGALMLAFSGCDSTANHSSTGSVPVAAACPSSATLAPPPASAPGAPPAGLSLRRTQINTGFGLAFPLFLTAPPGDTARLFVVEKGGKIQIVDRATNALIGTFLDITRLVSTGGEQGLLGLAFDPGYANNGRFYVSYTDKVGIGNSVIARYVVDSNDPNAAVPTADRIILTLTQPFENHNGGMIAFGPDGYLYLGFGDGGSGGDPGNRAQNPGELLGKLLRIDVSEGAAGQAAYRAPADNPCTDPTGAKSEIWSLGLRNPWRWSFDRQTGDLYIADVGQGAREEVNFATAASGAGRGTNYGWKITEGSLCFSPGSGCNTSGLTLPYVDYAHAAGGCSVTGGYVYRGAAIPALQGTYFYADFCAGFVRSFRMVNGAVTEHADGRRCPEETSPVSAKTRRAGCTSSPPPAASSASIRTESRGGYFGPVRRRRRPEAVTRTSSSAGSLTGTKLAEPCSASTRGARNG